MGETTRKKTKRIASKSANCCQSALGYLEAALGELDEASAWTKAPAGSNEFTDRAEAKLHDELRDLLEGSQGLRRKLHDLRDRRAARAGFSFDDEEV